MGAAIGDYDADGDLDWFVTSIWDPDGVSEGNWGVTGNRLYRNDGQGRFEDVTDEAGVRIGFWGWGACFADFDNDGHLDLYHVNGIQMAGPPFDTDPARLYLGNGDGSFREVGESRGVADRGNGRGLVCFDADQDGDIDLFVANSRGSPRFYRNEGGNRNSWLSIRVAGPAGNSDAIGAWIEVRTPDGRQQLREIRAGSNFVSNNPPEAHFGLGRGRAAVSVWVRWPDGTRQRFKDVSRNQRILFAYPGPRPEAHGPAGRHRQHPGARDGSPRRHPMASESHRHAVTDGAPGVESTRSEPGEYRAPPRGPRRWARTGDCP
jgi:hypothetical protein